MPRSPAKVTQADIARALRAMKQAYGGAEVVFEPDGRVRIIAAAPDRKPERVEASRDYVP